MSNLEICIIVVAALIPVVALVIILPSRKKKQKNQQITTEPKPEPKVEQKVETSAPAPKPKTQVNNALPISNNIKSEDFKSYLDRKRANTPPPKRNTYPYMPTESFYSRRSVQKKPPQSISEEIKNLSPELKALIFSGAFDSKFDD